MLVLLYDADFQLGASMMDHISMRWLQEKCTNGYKAIVLIVHVDNHKQMWSSLEVFGNTGGEVEVHRSWGWCTPVDDWRWRDLNRMKELIIFFRIVATEFQILRAERLRGSVLVVHITLWISTHTWSEWVLDVQVRWGCGWIWEMERRTMEKIQQLTVYIASYWIVCCPAGTTPLSQLFAFTPCSSNS